jgi:hypothetical protein
LYSIAEDLHKFDVHVDSMYTKNDTLWVSLVSSNSRQFTELIKYLSDTYFDEINEIDIEIIEKDQKSSYYKGLLKVEFK